MFAGLGSTWWVVTRLRPWSWLVLLAVWGPEPLFGLGECACFRGGRRRAGRGGRKQPPQGRAMGEIITKCHDWPRVSGHGGQSRDDTARCLVPERVGECACVRELPELLPFTFSFRHPGGMYVYRRRTTPTLNEGCSECLPSPVRGVSQCRFWRSLHRSRHLHGCSASPMSSAAGRSDPMQ